jgi:ribose 5-phosphate isomerase A
MSEELKRKAAREALEEIRDGMIVGLGSGSTASMFIQELARSRMKVAGIPASEQSRRLAEELGVPLTTLQDHPVIDVTVDGADEVSPRLDLIKGLGGALVREKIVARASKRVVIVVDESKLVERLGTKTVIPVEVVPFAAPIVLRQLQPGSLRVRNGQPIVTDNGNLIVDWQHGPIDNPSALDTQLKSTTGVVDSGIFADIASCVIAAVRDGIRRIERNK